MYIYTVCTFSPRGVTFWAFHFSTGDFLSHEHFYPRTTLYMWLSEALDGGTQFQVPFKPVSDASRGSTPSQTTPRYKGDMELPSGPAFGTREAHSNKFDLSSPARGYRPCCCESHKDSRDIQARL